MQLDDLKQTWKESQSPIKDKQTLNTDLIENMTAKKYRSKVNRIIIPEIAGSIVCLAAVVLIGLRFTKLDTVLLQATGAFSILLLLLLPIISILSTWNLIHVANVNKSYASTLRSFAVQKIRFIRLQKINVMLSYLLLVTVIVLLSRFIIGNDISNNKYYWLFSFTIGFIFLLFYSTWVEKYYRKSLHQAEELLKELAD